MNIRVVECTNSEFGLEEKKVEFYRTFTKPEHGSPILCKAVAKIPYSRFDDMWYEGLTDWNQAYMLRDELQEQFSWPRRFAVRCD